MCGNWYIQLLNEGATLRMTLDENTAQRLATFIHSHPTKMIIHLQKAETAYKVIYANQEASKYFKQRLGIEAPSYFGDLWGKVELALHNTYVHDLHNNIVNLSFLSGKAFEMGIQCIEENGHKIFQIELMKRPDLNYSTIRSNEQLVYLSHHDSLTGLWNRRVMKEHFAEDTMQAMKTGEKLAFIHLGLDRFKLINESIGRNGADGILIMVAERLKIVCPASSRIYRNGSDEFIITLLHHSSAQIEKVAQHILDDFGRPYYYQRQEYFLSTSIGIAVVPQDGEKLEEVLQNSEQALFFVKERGRGHYRFFRKEMNSSFPDEALMESHLRRAIEFNELSIYYQPQVDLKTGKINSFEALLRWNNRKFGFVSPSQFIPILEESGLIHKMGDWVLEQVCMQLQQWQRKQFLPVRIAVNISPKQFKLEGFAKVIKEKITRFGINPCSLEVEITESALTDMAETLATLNELKEIGVFISVDDFGTGYSSLSYLRQYPIDIIKIDRSFIKDIDQDSKNEAIAKTIINLAHNLGMAVIAEGVEKENQARWLLEAECQKAQGFLYCEPVPATVIEAKFSQYLKVKTSE